jgi:uncharacterized protein YcfL
MRHDSGAAPALQFEGNPELARALKMTNVVVTTRNDLKLVSLQLVNQRSHELRFQWTVDWYDRDHVYVGGAPRHWEPMTLVANGSMPISFVAPSPAAESFVLQFSTPDEVR